jgi:Flp pilus assembly protein TadD
VHPSAARGRRALDEGAFAEAARELGVAARDRPKDLAVWVDLGRAYVGAGDAKGAVDAFSHAVELSPHEARLQVFLGHAHELGRQYDLAEADYRKAIAIAPERAYPYRVLGARLLRWGRPEEAIGPLQRALSLDDSHAETHNAYAIALVRVGRAPEAEAAFRRAIARFPEERSLRLGLAAMLINASHYDQALDVYGELLSRWPTFAPAHVGRAVLFAELGQKAEAERELEAALALQPNNADYRARLDRLRGAQSRAP